MPIDIPTSALDSFSTENQRDLRRFAELILANVPGGAGYKYIIEEGTAPDSGTIISDSEVVASVASLDSDISQSSNSALLGGANHLIENANNTVVAGGDGHEAEGFNNAISGGSSNTLFSGATNSAHVGGTTSTISTDVENSVIVGGVNNTIAGDNAVIAGAERSLITTGGTNSFLTGQDGVGHRQWASVTAGGPNTIPSLEVCQTTVLSGACQTIGTTPRSFYMGNLDEIELLPNSTIMVRLFINAVRPSDFATQGTIWSGVAKRQGFGAVQVSWMEEEGRGGDVALDDIAVDVQATATGIEIIATGLAASTILWGCSAYIQEIQPV